MTDISEEQALVSSKQTLEERIEDQAALDALLLYQGVAKCGIEAGVDPNTFKNTLHRMEGRNWVASAKAIKGDEDLYQLLANLYVVPITSSFSTKVKAFLHLVFCEKVPFSAAKMVFEKESYDQM